MVKVGRGRLVKYLASKGKKAAKSAAHKAKHGPAKAIAKKVAKKAVKVGVKVAKKGAKFAYKTTVKAVKSEPVRKAVKATAKFAFKGAKKVTKATIKLAKKPVTKATASIAKRPAVAKALQVAKGIGTKGVAKAEKAVNVVLDQVKAELQKPKIMLPPLPPRAVPISMPVRTGNANEEMLIDLWARMNPGAAYMHGCDDFAGRLFIPNQANIDSMKATMTALKPKLTDTVMKKYLACLSMSLEFEEPYMATEAVLWGYFGLLTREGIVVDHMRYLALDAVVSLKAAKERLSQKVWPTVIRVLTANSANGAIGIVKTIIKERPELEDPLNPVVSELESYKRAFPVEGIHNGDFTEVYPILKAHGGHVGRKEFYVRILKDMYDYPETWEDIERKGVAWLTKELPDLKAITAKLAEAYKCRNDVETVAAEMKRRRKVERTNLMETIRKVRAATEKVVAKRLVKITPNYRTNVIETPPYLVNFMPTAAMSPFGALTENPFNIFFVTTDMRQDPAVAFPDLFQLIVHEEYGHCVNFSNSSTRFTAKPTALELIHTALALPITDGISFHRELESMNLLQSVAKKRPEERSEEEAAWVTALQEVAGIEIADLALEVEFIVREWRIIRFLRAIGDVRINMHRQTITEFIEWAHRETGLSVGLVFNQLFLFQAQVGYAPSYSMAGMTLKELQEKAASKKKNIVDFNTYASSLGFPGRTVWEKRLAEWK